MNLICPYCHKRLHLADRDVMSEAARIAGARAQGVGRKPVMEPCILCEVPYGGREMRVHLPKCTRKHERLHTAFMCPRCGKIHSAREIRKCKA